MSVFKHSLKLLACCLTFSATLAGCATAPGSAENEEDNLLGQHVRLLYQQWGNPEFRSDATGQSQQLHIWNIDGCMNNVSTRADGIITGYAVTGDCDY